MIKTKIVNKAKKKKVLFRRFDLKCRYMDNTKGGDYYTIQINKSSLKGRDSIV